MTLDRKPPGVCGRSEMNNCRPHPSVCPVRRHRTRNNGAIRIDPATSVSADKAGLFDEKDSRWEIEYLPNTGFSASDPGTPTVFENNKRYIRDFLTTFVTVILFFSPFLLCVCIVFQF